MNTRYTSIAFILLYIIINIFMKDFTFGRRGKSDTTDYVFIDIENVKTENKSFKVGEKLTYSIDYGPIQAGIATISVVDKIDFNGRECYHVVSEAYSSKAFSIIFRVEDKVESFIDAQGIFSWKIEKHLREGRFQSDKYYILDYIDNIAYSVDDTVRLPFLVQDALSSLFFVRTQKLEAEDSTFMQYFDNGKIYELEVKTLKREKIKVKAGIFDTILLEPLVTTIGVFRHGGQIRVWLTNDEKRIPVKMSTKVYLGSIGLGSISANLVKYEGID